MTRSLVEQKFAAAAKGYATSAVHAKGESLARVVALTRPEPHWQVLDVATGAGHMALALAPHVARVVASDLTPEMLDEARALAADRGLVNVETVRAEAERLPFPDAAFDLVTSRIAPHHFRDVGAFVREAARVLRPAGIFALVDNVGPDMELIEGASATEIALADRAYIAFEKVRDPSHNRALSLPEWRAVVAASGLVVTHEERLTKTIELDSWARRIGADDNTIAALTYFLEHPHPVLGAFLAPRRSGSSFTFTLHEGIVIAAKPAAPAMHAG